MGLNACCSLLKYLIVLINILFVIIGLSIIALATWMLCDSTFVFSISLGGKEQDYAIALYIFLALGAFLFIAALAGCCGAIKESQCLLVTFFCFFLIIVVAEVTSIGWSIHNKNHLNELITKSVQHTIRNEYSFIESRTRAIDTFQQHLKCCGAQGPGDWATSKFSQKNNYKLESQVLLMVSKVVPSYKVPESCCRESVTGKLCIDGTVVVFTESVFPYIYGEGCAQKLFNIVEENSLIIIGVMIAIILLQLFAVIFAITICCAMKNIDDYKA